MKYLVTYFNNLDYSDLYNTEIHTCIVNGKLNVLKIFLKHLGETQWSGEMQGFKCSCGLYYDFSLDHKDFWELDYSIVNYKTLHDLMINGTYICKDCQDTFNNKGTEIINFIKKIYNGTIDDYISITPHMQHICKIGIKLLNDLELDPRPEDGIVCKQIMPVLKDNDCFSKESHEYDVNYFDTKVEDNVS